MSEQKQICHYTSLLQLDDDVFFEILQELEFYATWDRRSRYSKALADTCQRMRYLYLPRTYRFTDVFLRRPSWIYKPGRYTFIPESLWPYVQNLSMIDHCPDSNLVTTFDPNTLEPFTTRRQPQYAKDHPLLCGVFDIESITNALHNMPLLSSVLISLYKSRYHGIRWDVLEQVLSVPTLRTFEIRNLLISPVLLPTENICVDRLACITSFTYRFSSLREPHEFPVEEQALTAILTRLAPTLETLYLHTDRMPVRALFNLNTWPRLQQLTLRGARWRSSATPQASWLSSMPNLRILVLELFSTLRDGADRSMIWPPDMHLMTDGRFELEKLTLAWPHPRDRFFSVLRPCLRELSLHSWPMHYHRDWFIDREVESTDTRSLTPSSSDMLQVLRQCHTPSLTRLHIEYVADDQEMRLLEYIPEKFPALVELEIHRCRLRGEIPLTAIGEALAPLHALRTLKVHLDFPDTPRLELGRRRYIYAYASFAAFKDHTVPNAAAALASVLALSVEKIYLLCPSIDAHFGDAKWAAFRVIPMPGELESSGDPSSATPGQGRVAQFVDDYQVFEHNYPYAG